MNCKRNFKIGSTFLVAVMMVLGSESILAKSSSERKSGRTGNDFSRGMAGKKDKSKDRYNSSKDFKSSKNSKNLQKNSKKNSEIKDKIETAMKNNGWKIENGVAHRGNDFITTKSGTVVAGRVTDYNKNKDTESFKVDYKTADKSGSVEVKKTEFNKDGYTGKLTTVKDTTGNKKAPLNYELNYSKLQGTLSGNILGTADKITGKPENYFGSYTHNYGYFDAGGKLNLGKFEMIDGHITGKPDNTNGDFQGGHVQVSPNGYSWVEYDQIKKDRPDIVGTEELSGTVVNVGNGRYETGSVTSSPIEPPTETPDTGDGATSDSPELDSPEVDHTPNFPNPDLGSNVGSELNSGEVSSSRDWKVGMSDGSSQGCVIYIHDEKMAKNPVYQNFYRECLRFPEKDRALLVQKQFEIERNRVTMK